VPIRCQRAVIIIETKAKKLRITISQGFSLPFDADVLLLLLQRSGRTATVNAPGEAGV
jgi:hypothetical protein